MADGLTTDDVDLTKTCKITISAVNCQNKRKNSLSLCVSF